MFFNGFDRYFLYFYFPAWLWLTEPYRFRAERSLKPLLYALVPYTSKLMFRLNLTGQGRIKKIWATPHLLIWPRPVRLRPNINFEIWRLCYEKFVGPIPIGFMCSVQLLSTIKNRKCIQAWPGHTVYILYLFSKSLCSYTVYNFFGTHMWWLLKCGAPVRPNMFEESLTRPCHWPSITPHWKFVTGKFTITIWR